MGKGAKNAGGASASNRRNKDQAMAAAMRDVVRTTARCPICHKIVSLKSIPLGHPCG